MIMCKPIQIPGLYPEVALPLPFPFLPESEMVEELILPPPAGQQPDNSEDTNDKNDQAAAGQRAHAPTR